MKKINEYEKVIKKDDGTYNFSSYFEAELTKKDYEDNIKKLNNQISLNKKIIAKHDTDKKVALKITELASQKQALKDAIKHYDEYFNIELDKLRKEIEKSLEQKEQNKELERQKLQEQLDNYDDYKESVINTLRVTNDNELDKYKIQLMNDERLLGVYKQYLTEDKQ